MRAEVVLSSELRLLMSFSWPCFPGVIWTRFFSPHGFPGFWDSIPKRCKGVHFVDLGESFQTHIFLQNFPSIQPTASPVKIVTGSNPQLTSSVTPRAPRKGRLAAIYWSATDGMMRPMTTTRAQFVLSFLEKILNTNSLNFF